MKKYIIGAVFGFVLSIGVGAHAEVVNMIGKVVDGTFAVKVGDTALDTPAITIEGTSYLPVRAFGDATGYDVKFDSDMGITLTPKMYTPAPTPQKQQLSIQTFKNINVNGTDKSGLENGMIEIDGNQYVPLNFLNGSPYRIKWDGVNHIATFSQQDKNDISVHVDDSYSINVESFIFQGTSYVKLSALGLKGTLTGDTLVIEKQ